jgi:hypothetical protein
VEIIRIDILLMSELMMAQNKPDEARRDTRSGAGRKIAQQKEEVKASAG